MTDKRPIDANALYEDVSRMGLTNGSALGRHSGMADAIAQMIQDAPTIDPESLRGHARWVRDENVKIITVDAYGNAFESPAVYCENADREELRRYREEEEHGLLLHLPVPLGAAVWRVRENPACHYGVRQAEIFLFGEVVTPRRIVEKTPFTLRLLDEWGKSVFATEEEGRSHLNDES